MVLVRRFRAEHQQIEAAGESVQLRAVAGGGGDGRSAERAG
jgi:hypothetical protein